MREITINFDKGQLFESRNFALLDGVVGLYLIFLKNIEIRYPIKTSRLIYIGMSEKITNSIGKRLSDHFEGTSGNFGISSYRKVDDIYFTHLNFETLRNTWDFSVEDLESYFILDFVKNYGVYPICNNKTGFEITKHKMNLTLLIDWKFFEKEPNHE